MGGICFGNEIWAEGWQMPSQPGNGNFVGGRFGYNQRPRGLPGSCSLTHTPHPTSHQVLLILPPKPSSICSLLSSSCRAFCPDSQHL